MKKPLEAVFLFQKNRNAMASWKKLEPEEIKETVFEALKSNANYYTESILGVPASHLDDRVFYHDNPFLQHAPFLSTLIHNPNHIGFHTAGESESFFKGTHQIEKELIQVCAEEVLKGEHDMHDGYVAAGGTEANMQAIWIYRNYFMQEFNASVNEICIVCSEDSHYSMHKASNVFNIPITYVDVDAENRRLKTDSIKEVLSSTKKGGIKHFIVVANMMTTMYGSVDCIDDYVEELQRQNCSFKIHIDGAFGGFFYPFSNENTNLNFENEHVDSVTLDAHKMLQAPYGTGIFLIRKGYMKYAMTKEASYVKGEDCTLIGSRSGANAIAVWMILMTYGPYIWKEKIMTLVYRTNKLCDALDNLKVKYFREAQSNIVAIKSQYINENIADKYSLVPDKHEQPNWYKIVVMDHVSFDRLIPFIEDLKQTIN